MTDHPQTLRRLAIDEHGARLQDEVLHGERDHTTSLLSKATEATVLVSLEQQVALHRKHAGAAYDALTDLLQMPGTRERIIGLAERRLAGPGFDEYGDAMFHQTFAELLWETDDELADAVNRMVAACARLSEDDHQRAALRLIWDRVTADA